MLKKIIYSLLERRHYWRYVSFSEMAELYTSRTLRTLAISMVSIFVAVYLYQNGYHLTFIMLYFAVYFAFKCLVTIPLAYFIARVGPKHSTFISCLLYVPALLILTLLPDYGVWALIGYGVFQSVSAALYEMSYLVNFSKIRVSEHVGKEISYMHILERVASGLSPVIGGLVAYMFGPQATLIVASITFALAALPLLTSPEPVQRHQKISYVGLPWRNLVPGFRAELAIGFDFLMSGSAWWLFIAIAIFGETTNVIYAKLGLLAAVTTIAAILSAKLFGMLIDRERSRQLLQFGVGLDLLTHVIRPFISTPVGAGLVNLLNETATIGYSMPFTKGLFDMADRLPGFRIVYISLMSLAASLGVAIGALILAGISMFTNEVQTLQIGFILVGLAVLLIGSNGFPALKKQG